VVAGGAARDDGEIRPRLLTGHYSKFMIHEIDAKVTGQLACLKIVACCTSLVVLFEEIEKQNAPGFGIRRVAFF
jgi:hypothetical protein